MTKKSIVTLGILLLAISGCANDIGEPSEDQAADTAQTEESPAPQKSQDESDVMTLGGILPLTGESGAYGTSMQKIAEIALAEINEDGGINGKKMVIQWEDGKCNAEAAAAAANTLIDNEKVTIIYGGFCNTETLGIAPIAEKAGVIVFSPASSTPEISDAGTYIFRNYPSDANQGKILAEEAFKKSYKKMAVLTEEHDYNRGIQKGFEEKLKELGGAMESETYAPEVSDFKTQLEKLKATGPDALFLNPQTPAKADLALKQIGEMGWEIPLIGNDIVGGYEDLTTTHKDLVEGMIVAGFHPDTESEKFTALAEKYEKLTGKKLPYETYAATAYDAVYILRDALETQGYDAAKIKDYLAGIRGHEGLAGTLTMDENGDPVSGYAVEEVQEGKALTVE